MNNKIREILQKFRLADDDEKHVLLDDLTIYLQDLVKYTNKINLAILERTYPADAVSYAKNLYEEFKRTIVYTEKFLLGKKFLDSSIYNIENLVEKSGIDRIEYHRFAKNEKDLAYKIGLVIADPRRVSQYQPILNKISSGKMDVDEFRKLFFHIKDILPSVAHHTNESFVSFEQFKINSLEYGI